MRPALLLLLVACGGLQSVPDAGPCRTTPAADWQACCDEEVGDGLRCVDGQRWACEPSWAAGMDAGGPAWLSDAGQAWFKNGRCGP